jgi:4-amino-4-deoxy-L-arabinose transferase-like glycosyltransferase
LILTVFVCRAGHVACHDSITSDETTYLAHSLEAWMTGGDGRFWTLGSARLPHLMSGFASCLSLRAAGELPTQSDEATLTALVVSENPHVLGPARAVAIGWGVALLCLVYAAGRMTSGARAGLVAAAICSLVPELIAHSAIAGSDLPFTTCAVFTLIALARYLAQPTRTRWLIVAVGLGLAWATRHSAIILLPLAAGVRFLQAFLQGAESGVDVRPLLDRLLDAALSVIAMAAIAFAILWVGDGLGVVRVREVAEQSMSRSVPERLGPLDISAWPLPTSLVSLVKQIRHQAAGHEAYYLGEHGSSGWLTYYPVAFLLKTPCGFLILMILAAAAARWRCSWDTLALAMIGLLWIALLRSRVNIGLRYALLTYPLAAIWIGRYIIALRWCDHLRAPLTAVAIAWLAWSSLQAHPRYLSWFNELGGGPAAGWMYLADSNLDWGQDARALEQTVAGLGIDAFTYDISTERRLEVPGVLAVRNPPRVEQVKLDVPPQRRLPAADGSFVPVHTRYVAISVSRLMGLYSQNDMSWLRTRAVVARVGDSVFVFDLDRRADVPLGL